MRMKIWQGLALMVSGLWMASQAHAHAYSARLDVAKWQNDSTALECKLWQDVPMYGRAVFSMKPGSKLSFYLDSRRPSISSGRAVIKSVAPLWKSGVRERNLGTASVTTGKRPVVVGDDMASRMIAELELGMFPRVQLNGFYQGHSIDVDVSSVNFQRAYLAYQDCVANLSPWTLDELARTMVNFEFDKSNLQENAEQRLDALVNLIKNDSTIKSIAVDGHTDAKGSVDYNYALSERRANAVKAYLIQAGIPEDKIKVGFHSKLNPLTENQSDNGRAKNRRVTVVLERG
ncbi:MAG TPA: OmpA family protein [Pseudomonadales bacterium]|nr:OmpA family protein [Pseudomonadales bacterium]